MWRNSTSQQDAVNKKFMKAFAIPLAFVMFLGFISNVIRGDPTPRKLPTPAYQFVPRDDGPALYGSFGAYSKTCIPNQFMPKGEFMAVMNEIGLAGYNFNSTEQSKLVSQKRQEILTQLSEDPKRKTSFCKMWENHIDELLFGKGYKRGGSND